MSEQLSRTWDLDSIFPGGSGSSEFAAFLVELAADIPAVAAKLDEAHPTDATAWRARIDELQDLAQRLRHAGAFVSCLAAQDVHDHQARALSAKSRQLYADFASVLTRLDSMLVAIEPTDWQQLLASDQLRPLAFVLDERRRRAAQMLPPEQETLVNDLSVDGYHGWSDLYDLTTGRMTIEFEHGGEQHSMSPGQAANRMSDPDPELRSALLSAWESAWSGQAEYCALALNHLAGFRLNLYRSRGWDSALREPLDINRMQSGTLDAMWQAIERRKEPLQEYLAIKQRMLGLDRLNWADLDAPVGRTDTLLSYEAAAAFITEQFGRFDPALAELAQRAFAERWIESEDRPGKRMGGFCTSFPGVRQSRIFVTFSGTMGNLATLAHELGHAYHQHVMNDMEPLNQQYAMNVAETASTFAEMIVSDAALRAATDPAERLVLVEDRLRRATALLMNIQCRFLFETRFYEERRQGTVGVARLNELMVEAQREAYRDSLGVYHPTFWASKLHFYHTRVPFYNFPYTFGYLFSAGVYAKALSSGPGFAARYADLLRDTGRMNVEELAATHLEADLTSEAFWGLALDGLLEDVAELRALTG